MSGKAAVFTGVHQPLETVSYPLPHVEPRGILVRISMCTVCGSDVHTWTGHRPGDTPAILGHEIVGRIEALGPEVTVDCMGAPLAVGDRITWAMYASCGSCYYCRVLGIPQKCTSLAKYGHVVSDRSPHFNGGFAEYIYLRPGTVVLKVPDDLLDEEVAPINCSTATVASGYSALPVKPEDVVVVQGAGMLGLCAAAMARDRGASCIIVVDVDGTRLEIAKRFGADFVINARGMQDQALAERVQHITDGPGADLVVEVSGDPSVLPSGLEMLRIGGRYLLLGLVSPGALIKIDGWKLVFKCVTVRGVHNYDAPHLVEALKFVQRTRNRFPFRELVAQKFPLEETEQALRASQNKTCIRPAVVPSR